MRATLIADAAAAAADPDNFFRSPDFLDAEGATHTIALGDDLRLPVIVREIEGTDGVDAISPYGYPGGSGRAATPNRPRRTCSARSSSAASTPRPEHWCPPTPCRSGRTEASTSSSSDRAPPGRSRGGGGGTTGGGSGTQFAAASANDLANRAFTFPTGLSPTLATRYGLPAGQMFTLQFGTFTGATAPLTLDSGGQTATGTVLLGSCTFRFDQSGFPTGQGPQAGTQVVADPCETEVNQHFLRLTDPPSRESVTSSAPTPLTKPNTAFVLTTDSRTGSYSVVDLATLIHYVAEVQGIQRIRFTTSHPVEFSDSLVEAYANVPKLANHLHLAVQLQQPFVLPPLLRAEASAGEDQHQRIAPLQLRERARFAAMVGKSIVGKGRARNDVGSHVALL